MDPDLDVQVAAIRGGVALAELDDAVLRLPGGGALAALQRACPADLSLREGALRQALFLHDDARPLADVTVCRTEDGALLLCDGPEDLAGRVRAWTGHPVEDLGGEARLFAITGPYAWEPLGRLFGTGIYAVPPLFGFRHGRWRCFRAGRTGEYSYLVLVPRDEAASFVAEVQELGAGRGVTEVGREALDHCALESFCFNLRREGRAEGVTPIELQLQWRVSYDRDFPGAEALRARRRQGIRRRLTAVVSDGEMAVGDAVLLSGRTIGEVVNAGRSLHVPPAAPGRPVWVGMALIDRPLAVAGIGAYSLGQRGATAPLRTVSPPALLARSLFVAPGV